MSTLGRGRTKPIVVDRPPFDAGIMNLKLMLDDIGGVYANCEDIGIRGAMLVEYANGTRKISRAHLMRLMSYFRCDAQTILGWVTWILDDGEIIEGGDPSRWRDQRKRTAALA